ncbi:putative cytochrome P450 alkane hydroxylase [Amylocarpus encephaloides]|uniref:Cytochrome P450 alkane hydroxylase n=1 Tax=Amylocarpus encephaloides TaxID=45428 RepID=A0A9P7Y778_9HELO|nr:putative cytochrome P450 alkane hydroxylase [Amylocarpus encephaloides]
MAYSFSTVVALLTLVFAVKRVINSISIAIFKRRNGCQQECRVSQLDPILGLDVFRIQLAAFKNKGVLSLAKARYDTYGLTWSINLLGNRFYNTIETENIKSILATNFKDFGIGGRQKAFNPLLGSGIFTTDGAQWEHSRSLIRPSFTRSQVADLDTFEAHIKQLLAKIPRDGTTFDLQPLLFKLTLDSATEFLFGESVNSLSSAVGSEQERVGKAFDFAQSKLALRIRMGNLSFLQGGREFTKACKEVHEFFDEIVRKQLEKTEPKDAEKSIDSPGKKGKYRFLDELIKSTRDPKQLRDELLNILLAGRDTTASLLSNTIHALVRNPKVWRNLRAEINGLDGAKPDYETLRNLKYLKYVLNESLRLFPVVPVNVRFALKDTILPVGGGTDGQSPLYIPRGGTIAYSVYSLHRRTDIYGADAETFRPERWAPEEGLRPGWAYIPFNGGPRICVGQQFALTEASYTIVRLVQEFGDSLEDRDGSDWVEQVALTAASANGVKVAVAV